MLINSGLWLFDSIASHIWQIIAPVIDTTNKVYYAVDVELDCSPCERIDSIGLLNGHIRAITGRPDFDGTPGRATYEGGAANNNLWYEGLLLNGKVGTSSQSIDVSIMGEVGSFSGFRFSICDSQKQWQYINAGGIQFTNRKITHYVVIDNVFYPLWSGVVESIEYDDAEIEFSCANAFNSIHHPMPPRSAIAPEYSDADASDEGKAIPIIIGDVVDAQLVLTNKSINELNITNLSTNLRVAGLWDYDISGSVGIVSILSWTKNWATDGLIGKYMLPVNGSGGLKLNKMILITGNDVTSQTPISTVPPLTKSYTPIYLAEALSEFQDIYDNFDTKYKMKFGYDQLPMTEQKLMDYWNVKIMDFIAEYSLSNSAVAEILSNANGRPIIRVWNEQRKQYDDISKLFLDGDLLAGTIQMKPRVLTGNESAQYNVFITPNIISVVGGNVNPDQKSLMTQYANRAVITGDVADLTDRDRSTFVSVFYEADYTPFIGAVIAIQVDDALRLAAQEGNLALSVDATLEKDAAAYTLAYNLHTVGYDLYGRALINTKCADYLHCGGSTEEAFVFNLIPDEYYNFGGFDNGEECDLNRIYADAEYHPISARNKKKFLYDIRIMDEDFVSLIAKGAISKIELVVSFCVDGLAVYPNWQIDVKEVTFMQSASVGIDSDNIVVSVKGETTSGYETNNVYRALQHILLDYDGIDAGDADFGNLPTKRQSWHAGRQLTDRKSSLDYIAELCRQSFIAYWQKRGGELAFSAWRESVTIAAFHNDSVILRDSIKAVQRTTISSLYNEFSILYGWSNITDRYEREFFITKIDSAAFPAESDATWMQYVGGLSSDSYADAKALWDQCHAAYLKSNTINKFEAECPWFMDCSTIPDYGGGAIGTSSSAFMLLRNLVEWATWQKKIVQYDLAITEDTAKLELMQYVSFEDYHLTDSAALGGWIVGIQSNPESNTRSISVMLAPVLDAAEEDNTIIETGDSPEIIESGSNTETIVEGA